MKKMERKTVASAMLLGVLSAGVATADSVKHYRQDKIKKKLVTL